MNTHAASPSSSDERTHTLARRFLTAANTLYQIAGQLEGSDVRALSSELSYFKSLSAPVQMQIVMHIEAIVESAIELLSTKESPSNNRLLVLNFLKRMGWRVPDDVFLTYKAGDFIDIYDGHNQLCFLTLTLISNTTYTIEDLFCRSWSELWTREATITQLLMERAKEVLTSKEKKVLYMTIPVHQLFALDTDDKKTAWVHCKIFAPVMNKENEVVAFLAVNELRSTIWNTANN